MIEELKGKIVNGNKNLIIVGDFLSGKTKDVVFPIIDEKINRNESLIIYDTKDEYINNYYRILKEKKYNIVILNYKDLDKSEAWNPLSYPYKLYKEGYEDKAIDYLEQIGKTIFYIAGSDPYWTETAKDFFMGSCLALFEDAKEEEINLSSVVEILKGFREQIVDSNYTCEYFNMKQQNSKAALLASATYLAPTATRASIISVAIQKMMVLISRVKFNNLLSTTTINFDDCISKPTAIFILASEQNYIRNMSLVFVSQIVKILIDNKSQNKYNVVLEDIESTDYVAPLKEIVGSSLYENIKFYITSINLNELCKKYNNFDRTSLVLGVEKDKFILADYNEKIEYNRVENPGVLIDYPNIQVGNPSIFDLKSFVDKKRAEKIEVAAVANTVSEEQQSEYETNNQETENVETNEEKIKKFSEMLDEQLANMESRKAAEEEKMRKINEMLDSLESKNDNTEEKIQQFNENITDNLDKEMSDDLKNYEADFAESYELENAEDIKDYEVDFTDNIAEDSSSNYTIDDYVKLVDEKIAKFREEQEQQEFNENADDTKDYDEEKDNNNNEVDLTNNKYTIDDLVRLIDEKIAKIEAEEAIQQENNENN